MNFAYLSRINWVDVIVLILLIRGTYVGLKHGFSIELFKTLGAIAATILSLLYYQGIGNWLAAHSFLSLQIANFTSFSTLLILLLIAFKVVRIIIFKILHLELFGKLETWGGLILGLARSIILASLFVFALTLVPVEYIKESVEEKSFSGPYLKEIAPRVLDFVLKFRPKD